MHTWHINSDGGVYASRRHLSGLHGRIQGRIQSSGTVAAAEMILAVETLPLLEWCDCWAESTMNLCITSLWPDGKMRYNGWAWPHQIFIQLVFCWSNMPYWVVSASLCTLFNYQVIQVAMLCFVCNYVRCVSRLPYWEYRADQLAIRTRTCS